MPRTLQLTGARGRAFDAGPGYALRHVIGRGAFGCVMAAECRATGRGVAVKQVADAGEDAAAARRLLRELRLLRLLGGHLNVIRLLDVVVADAGGQVSAQLKSRSRLRLLAKSAPLTLMGYRWFFHSLFRLVSLLRVCLNASMRHPASHILLETALRC